MNGLVYLAAAISCVALAARAWRRDPTDAVRRSFAQFALFVGVAYLGFAIYLTNGMAGSRFVEPVMGAFIPVSAGQFFDRWFRTERPPHFWVRRGWVLSVLGAASYVAVDALLYADVPRASPAEVVLTTGIFVTIASLVRGLLRVRNGLVHVRERARVDQLLVLVVGASGLSAVEFLVRALSPALDPTGLSPLARAALVQGAFPPIGAVVATLLVYFLAQSIDADRLLDLQEIFARITTVVVLASILAVVEGVAVAWVENLAAYPIHVTFQVFLASILFLTMVDPLRARVDSWSRKLFDPPGQSFHALLMEIERGLSQVISLDGLDRELVLRLQSSGRASLVTLYVWDQERSHYRLAFQRGESKAPLQRFLPGPPFIDGFAAGLRTYVRTEFERASKRPGGQGAIERLRTMDVLEADVVIPLRVNDVVVGWLGLRSESGSKGFSSDEVARLAATVDRAALVLDNLRGFARLEEQHRLAALGTMSAGLAHEIRNPLAGIKGAAQYLQGVADPKEMTEFVNVIQDEVDRLNVVVTQFLDYARPFEVHTEVTDLGQVARHVAGLVRAELKDTELRLDVEIDDEVQAAPVDRDKVAQVILNLVRNAVQASPRHVGIRVARGVLENPPRRGRPAVVVSITDDGQGIAAHDLDNLFIPFFTTKRDGTGLGLAISRRLVEAHQGEIAVRSTPGEGTQFSVRFPTA